MANFQTAIQTLLKHEGGLTNDPDDAGGITNFGISQKNNPSINVAMLTPADAAAYYFTNWWKKYRLDQINDDDLACYILDHGVNTGMPAVVCVVQQVVGTIVDGVIGSNTIAAINAHYFPMMLSAIQHGLWIHYQKILAAHPEDDKYKDGWYVRCFEL